MKTNLYKLSLTMVVAVWGFGVGWAQEQAPATPTEPVMVEDDPGATNAAVELKGVNRGALVKIGKDVELPAGDSAEAVVAIGGSVKVLGNVSDAAVAIAGDLEVQGEVRDVAVAVLGDVTVRPGARVRGDVVSVGGKVVQMEGATIEGDVQEVDFGMIGLATPEWLRAWFRECALKLRPLAPSVGWVWAVAGAFFLFYLLVAWVFPRPVQACVAELTERPATTLLMGILTKILVPILFFILAATGIGLIVVPFLIAALVLGAIVGKVALVEAVGMAIGRQFNVGALEKPLAGFLVGTVLILLLYMVPVLGLLTLGLTAVWGLGGAVLASFGSLRRETKGPDRPETGTYAVQPAGAAGGEIPAGGGNPGVEGGTMGATAVMQAPPELSAGAFPYPKASFWERMGAAFLDVVLVSILGSIVGGPPWGFLVALAYFAGMWAWKETTIGGIVLGIKIARLDQKPVSFAVGLVRGLAAAFSIVVLFLGFLWIAWDKDKQGWHDKIAGTVVLKLPRGTPLVCL